MKRLDFKPDFRAPILKGEKTGTLRHKSRNLKVGETVAAVTSLNGKPAWLTPVSERFAELVITEACQIAWRDVTEEHLSRTTVPRDWYEKRIPGLNEDTMLWFYGFTGEARRRGEDGIKEVAS